MSSAVVVADQGQDVAIDVHTLAVELDEKNREVKALTATLAKKEAEIRRSREEHKLLLELNAVNSMTLRKMDNDSSRPNKMPIAPESLAEIIRLENLIKLESKKSNDQHREADLLQAQIQDVEAAIEQNSGALVEVRAATGWEERTKTVMKGVNLDNRFTEMQLKLSKLQAEQATLKASTATLTQQIEDHARELDERKNVDEELFNAQTTLAQKQREYEELQEQVQSMKRIGQKKEKLIEELKGKDDYKTVRLLEGDKRVLHSDVSKQMEKKRMSENSILAQDARLRQIESRLAAVAAGLKSVFPSEDAAQYRPDVEAGAEDVPVALFNQVQDDLASARLTLRDRDEQLEEFDAQVESLERKVDIVRGAKVSRSAVSLQDHQDMEKERAVLESHIQHFEDEFNREQDRLLQEQQRLQAALNKLARGASEQ